MSTSFLARCLLATWVALAANCVAAQTGGVFPTRPVTIIVPFTPGSTSDIVARLFAQKIAAPLGQPVVVENRPGANGAIGMQAVARSRPDGHTLVVGSVASTVAPYALQKSVAFDLLKDFVPVCAVAGTTLVLMVAHDAPYQGVEDLVEKARKAPGTMSYANSAGLYRIAMEAFNLQAGIDLAPIAYKGPADAIPDLVTGRLTVAPDSLGSATKLIRSGRTRALAVLGERRDPALPGVPTMQELGYKDFDFNGVIGLFAPAGTPAEALQRISSEISRAMASEEVRQQYGNLALDPMFLDSRRYTELIRSDLNKYQRIAREARIEKQ